ncbi:MAG: ABC transporter ATP-binding protein [Acidimicrobiia bacterium]
MTGPVRVACSAVSVDVGGRRLLEDVHLAVHAGEWVCVLGPNGAGKTTLLRVLSGSLAPSAGRVEIDGRPLPALRVRDRARAVAVVPQVPVVPPGMTALEYVLLGRTPHHGLFGSLGRHDVAVARESLASLELGGLAGRTVDSLSGGERQRVIVARALAQDAPVLLLDEPTSSLDIGHQQEVMELVDALRRERDLAVLSTMHDLTLAGQYADRLVLLRDGRVTHTGRADEVMTAENLELHYGARVAIVDGPHGRVVVPYRGAV